MGDLVMEYSLWSSHIHPRSRLLLHLLTILKSISQCIGLRSSKLGRLPNFLRSAQKYNFPERIFSEYPRVQKRPFPKDPALGSCMTRSTSLRKGYSQVLGPISANHGLWISRDGFSLTLPLKGSLERPKMCVQMSAIETDKKGSKTKYQKRV